MDQVVIDVIDKWSNLDNAHFYENISIETMLEYAKKGGFDDCCDVQAIHYYLIGANLILDLGAGYGRAIKYLNKHFPNAKLTALERSSSFCAHMQEQSRLTKLNYPLTMVPPVIPLNYEQTE